MLCIFVNAHCTVRFIPEFKQTEKQCKAMFHRYSEKDYNIVWRFKRKRHSWTILQINLVWRGKKWVERASFYGSDNQNDVSLGKKKLKFPS